MIPRAPVALYGSNLHPDRGPSSFARSSMFSLGATMNSLFYLSLGQHDLFRFSRSPCGYSSRASPAPPCSASARLRTGEELTGAPIQYPVKEAAGFSLWCTGSARGLAWRMPKTFPPGSPTPGYKGTFPSTFMTRARCRPGARAGRRLLHPVLNCSFLCWVPPDPSVFRYLPHRLPTTLSSSDPRVTSLSTAR